MGTGRVRVYDEKEHISISFGKPDPANCLVRVHSECLTSEVLGSQRCDCAGQLRAALKQIAKEGGVLVYLRQEGRGIGLSAKIRAYALQDKEKLDTVEANHRCGHSADERDYGVAVAILDSLGISAVRLLTNNPDKVAQLEAGGIKVLERLPVLVKVSALAKAYLQVKRERLGHHIP